MSKLWKSEFQIPSDIPRFDPLKQPCFFRQAPLAFAASQESLTLRRTHGGRWGASPGFLCWAWWFGRISGWWFGTCFIFPLGIIIIPTDELHHFSEGWLNHQPDIVAIYTSLYILFNVSNGHSVSTAGARLGASQAPAAVPVDVDLAVAKPLHSSS